MEATVVGATEAQSEPLVAFVSWPLAPLTESLVRNALLSLAIQVAIADGASIHSSLVRTSNTKLIQWSSYDELDHSLIHSDRPNVLSSSYVIRKALIRKHFLSRCIRAYSTKRPDSILQTAVPKTWEIDISFADDLDELWADELWELSVILDRQTTSDADRWWILKPGMADRGMGIRVFDSKDALRQILADFDDSCSDGDGDVAPDETVEDTSVAISQLRHFVIQEYLSKPLLLDPHEVPSGGAPSPPTDQLQGHKFHLRAYCVAAGDLTLYLYTRVLALFSSKLYTPPAPAADGGVDLEPHLTNSSLQTHRGEEGVRLLDELVGCHVMSGDAGVGPRSILTQSHLENIQDQMADTLSETFKAAVQSPIHFQPVANAFELYGVDFLVEHTTSSRLQFQVKLLEINAEPAIELTGPRLTWILEDLFKAMARVCVDPFVRDSPMEAWPVGDTKHYLKKCLQTKVRGF